MDTILTGQELLDTLAVLPPYDPEIRVADAGTRLMALQDLYEIYIPTEMSVEIYHKMFMALQGALRKKNGIAAVRQRNANYQYINGGVRRGILGGVDSFTIIGTSGIGKSAAIERVIEILGGSLGDSDISMQSFIPCLLVQCPFDASPKGLLLEILRKVDEYLGSAYYPNAIRARATQDMLIGNVSQVCLNHVGILIIDEIQNVVENKNGRNLVGMLTQMINAASGVGLCMVGTPESCSFFERAIHLSRRSTGLKYGPMAFDETFRDCCRTLWQYQYVQNFTELSPAVEAWLYEHSHGILAALIALIHDIQEEAILTGKERITLQGLDTVYAKGMAMLEPHLQVSVQRKRRSVPQRVQPIVLRTKQEEQRNQNDMSEVRQILLGEMEKASADTDIIPLLRQADLIGSEVAI